MYISLFGYHVVMESADYNEYAIMLWFKIDTITEANNYYSTVKHHKSGMPA